LHLLQGRVVGIQHVGVVAHLSLNELQMLQLAMCINSHWG
jgi:hypothetical protein